MQILSVFHLALSDYCLSNQGFIFKKKQKTKLFKTVFVAKSANLSVAFYHRFCTCSFYGCVISEI